MKELTTAEIRSKFIEFFKSKQHVHLPSSPLVPYNDPTVLLTTAGMLQFKPIMFGTEKPTHTRVTTYQKCFRTTDLDNVGFTPRHHTFFEMLGNFSFGDYYKEEAITWAWEFITEHLEIPKEKLYVSVYEEDPEAYEIWHQKIGVPAEHLARLGARDNFWAAGETGPCGPCSEIYYDLGESLGQLPFKEDVLSDGNRYLEFWNLVFMEFNRQEDGSLIPLPSKNIDTGMGLERIASILQGKSSNYATDLLQKIILKVKPKVSEEMQQHLRYETALNVIADHSRASAMLIGDGVQPGNEGRGYVLRRILRRAMRFGHFIGINQPFLYELLPTIVEIYPIYETLREKSALIQETMRLEEERFHKTLSRGMKKLEEALSELGQAKIIPGPVAFELYDTYGFPAELTQEIAQEQGLSVDMVGYKVAMQAQVERARAASRSHLDLGAGVVGFAPTVFTGYTQLTQNTKLLGCLEAHEENLRRLILEQTPFYAESGGQVSDHGIIKVGAHQFEVVDVQKVGEVYVHIVQGEGFGILGPETPVQAVVEHSTRRETMKHHSVTHLMHRALKDVLGDQVSQAGSEVTHYHTRFDFSFNRAVSPAEIQAIEALVNDAIMENLSVSTQVLPIEEARQTGAVAMFGEKYGEKVRVISMGDYSIEFCGGTHVSATGMIGSFKIISEEAIAAGVRRITAVAGKQAYLYSRQNEALLRQLSQELKVPFQEIPRRFEKFQEQLKGFEKELKQTKQKLALQEVTQLAQSFKPWGEIQVLAQVAAVPDAAALKQVAEELLSKHHSAIVVLAAELEGKVSLVAAISEAAQKKGLKAGNLIKDLSPYFGARGGGKPAFAQAGGGDQIVRLPELESKVLQVLQAEGALSS